MAHVHEKIDFCVSAYIVHNNKVLLIHHKKLNIWLPVGGHIELHENTDEALFREIKEECGLEVELLSKKPDANLVDETYKNKFLHTPDFMDIHNFNETHQHIAMTYFARAKSADFSHNTEEHNNIRWFSLEDLDSKEFQVIPFVQFLAKEALKRATS